VQKHPAHPVAKRQEQQTSGARTAPAGIQGDSENDNQPKSERSGKAGEKKGDRMPRGRKPLLVLSEAKHFVDLCDFFPCFSGSTN
jgi:hypothetical protein